MALRLAAPWNLACLLAVVPVAAAFVAVHARRERALAALGLLERRRWLSLVPALLACLAVALVAVAAARPEVVARRTTPVRTDAQAYVVVDTSTSMLARRSLRSAARIDEARRLARRIVDRIPRDVPVGVAEMPQSLLPLLVPTVDRALADRVLDEVVTVGAIPAKPQDQLVGTGVTTPQITHPDTPYVATSLTALKTLSLARFFSPRVTRRLAILLTDAESARFDPADVAALLERSRTSLLILRVGSAHDRLWRPIGGRVTLDSRYVPSTSALPDVSVLATLLGGGGPYRPDQLGRLESRARDLLGSGPHGGLVRSQHALPLGPYAVLAALVVLGALLADVLPVPRAALVRLRPIAARKRAPARAPRSAVG